jgi:protein gp37
MVEGEWTVATTRQMVGNFKNAEQPPVWCNGEEIAKALLIGQLSIPDLAKIYSYPGRVKVDDEDIREAMMVGLLEAKPSRLSEVQDIANRHEKLQNERNEAARKEEAEKQRKEEEAKAKTARLQKDCSLEEWQSLNDQEKEMLLAPPAGQGGSFNQQKGDSIEWAQWSWNPVTGCKHDCPYCYARDIALGERMQRSGLYPNGWEPTFRSLSLNAPMNTKVPKSAAEDTRFRNVFTCSMADLFGRWVPVEWINAVMMAVRGNPQWNFLFLTKFPQRFAEIEIPDNAWMGTTVDMQARVNNAEKAFSKLNTGVRWLSVEPMIEPIKLNRPELFNWVVIGGASPSKQTPGWQPPYRWIESLVRQCDDAGVPVYMKSNLGIANRVLQLPFDAPVKGDPQQAPSEMHYLGSNS